MGAPTIRLQEAIENGIVEFTPPWLGDVLLEIVARLEALEGQVPTNKALIAAARSRATAIPYGPTAALLLALADALEACD